MRSRRIVHVAPFMLIKKKNDSPKDSDFDTIDEGSFRSCLDAVVALTKDKDRGLFPLYVACPVPRNDNKNLIRLWRMGKNGAIELNIVSSDNRNDKVEIQTIDEMIGKAGKSLILVADITMAFVPAPIPKELVPKIMKADNRGELVATNNVSAPSRQALLKLICGPHKEDSEGGLVGVAKAKKCVLAPDEDPRYATLLHMYDKMPMITKYKLSCHQDLSLHGVWIATVDLQTILPKNAFAKIAKLNFKAFFEAWNDLLSSITQATTVREVIETLLSTQDEWNVPE